MTFHTLFKHTMLSQWWGDLIFHLPDQTLGTINRFLKGSFSRCYLLLTYTEASLLYIGPCFILATHNCMNVTTVKKQWIGLLNSLSVIQLKTHLFKECFQQTWTVFMECCALQLSIVLYGIVFIALFWYWHDTGRFGLYWHINCALLLEIT
jgi:hypothetical protein